MVKSINSSPIFLRRYLSLSRAKDILRACQLSFSDPENWDDENDKHYMQKYRESRMLNYLGAICFAEGPETVQHWKMYAGNVDGVMIQFKRDKFLNSISSKSSTIHGPIEYVEIKDIRTVITRETLPFLKRIPYKDEAEYRILHTAVIDQKRSPSVSIEIDWIDRVVFNPWLCRSSFEKKKMELKGIQGCSSLKIYQTTLLNNSKWIRAATDIVATT